MNIISRTFAPEERHRQIETAAYYRAQKRGFSNGDPLKDWLEAEREIDALFTEPDDASSSMQKRAAYQRLRTEFKRVLAGAHDSVNTDIISQALERSGRELKAWGKYVPAAVDRAGKRLKQEVTATVGKMSPRRDAVSEKRHGLFEIWKGQGDQLFNQAQSALNSWVSRYRNPSGKKNKENSYKP